MEHPLWQQFRRWLSRKIAGEVETEEIPHSDCLGLDFLFIETKDMLVRQLARVEALDNKAGLLAGFDGVIITAAVGLLPTVVSITPARWMPWSLWVVIGVMILGVVAVLVSFLFAVKAYQVRSYHDVVNPKTAYESWIYWPERKSKIQLLVNMNDGYFANEKTLGAKATAIKLASWGLLVGLVSFCASALMFVAITVK